MLTRLNSATLDASIHRHAERITSNALESPHEEPNPTAIAATRHAAAQARRSGGERSVRGGGISTIEGYPPQKPRAVLDGLLLQSVL